MSLSISIGSMKTLSEGLAKAPKFTEQALVAAVTEGTLLVQREWQENLPRVSGLTAQSIQSDVASTPVGVLGIVSSSQPSAVFVELGTRAHMPPIEALVPWVTAVLGITEIKEARQVAFLIARKIARKGTKAQRPAGRAVEATRGQVVAMFERAIAQVADFIRGSA